MAYDKYTAVLYINSKLPAVFCEGGVAGGFQWPRIAENSASELPCYLASSMFRRETLALRRCLDGGRWEEPDLTTCTLRANSKPFLIVWFVLDPDGTNSGGSGISSGGGVPEDPIRTVVLEAEVGVCTGMVELA